MVESARQRLTCEVPYGVPPVLADRRRVYQVLSNLVGNALKFGPAGASITIRVEPSDREVRVSVSDTGHGMDPVTQSRIFEPFFTTKEQGKGTGLGLAVCYGIVNQAGGHVWVYSDPGRGTTFKVFLPRVTEEDELSLEVDGFDLTTAGGSETVLVVEDEPLVRSLAVRALEDQGYSVLQAEEGWAALAASRAYEGEIHLLVTDVVMPAMNGKELADRLSAERPGLRVLYVSGYTDHAVVRHGVLEEGIAFLSKPFDMSSLARTVREVLDSGKVAR
jgi:two-component system cell cycle sensor histidine kinase/response regulator CckA